MHLLEGLAVLLREPGARSAHDRRRMLYELAGRERIEVLGVLHATGTGNLCFHRCDSIEVLDVQIGIELLCQILAGVTGQAIGSRVEVVVHLRRVLADEAVGELRGLADIGVGLTRGTQDLLVVEAFVLRELVELLHSRFAEVRTRVEDVEGFSCCVPLGAHRIVVVDGTTDSGEDVSGGGRTGVLLVGLGALGERKRGRIVR